MPISYKKFKKTPTKPAPDNSSILILNCKYMHLYRSVIEKCKCSKIRFHFISYSKRLCDNRIMILHSKTANIFKYSWKHDMGTWCRSTDRLNECICSPQKYENVLKISFENQVQTVPMLQLFFHNTRHCCVFPEISFHMFLSPHW